MTTSPGSTRHRLIQAALDLFVAQGISGTTTRQIAATAAVNEVTLFRQFGNKQGLVLAVLSESTAFQQLGESLVAHTDLSGSLEQGLRQYVSYCLHSLEQMPQFLRSLIGEAEQSPPENQLALGQVIAQANQTLAQHLDIACQREGLTQRPMAMVALLNHLLLGYAVVELTSNAHHLWTDQDEFIDHVIALMCQRPVPDLASSTALSIVSAPLYPPAPPMVQELSASTVHQILRHAKKAGVQDYALAYILFAAGLSPTEIASLDRSAQISENHQHLLQITTGNRARHVPVNQWVMGKRYGSYTSNPLTKWLKNRQDKQPYLFLNATDQPITVADINHQWQRWTADLATTGEPLSISQAQQTWIIDMVLRGISLDNLTILTGQDKDALQPYVQRAQRITALEQAARLDQKPSSNVVLPET